MSDMTAIFRVLLWRVSFPESFLLKEQNFLSLFIFSHALSIPWMFHQFPGSFLCVQWLVSDFFDVGIKAGSPSKEKRICL